MFRSTPACDRATAHVYHDIIEQEIPAAARTLAEIDDGPAPERMPLWECIDVDLKKFGANSPFLGRTLGVRATDRVED